MASSKKNDDDSDYHDESDEDSSAVASSSKKTAEEVFRLAANATLPARRRTQPNIYGSTPSPSLPPPSKPTKKKPTAPLVNSGRTNQSNNKSQKKRGRAATKKKTLSAPITTTVTTNPPVNPSLTMNGTFLVSLSFCTVFSMCRAYRSSNLSMSLSIPHILITSFLIFQIYLFRKRRSIRSSSYF